MLPTVRLLAVFCGLEDVLFLFLFLRGESTRTQWKLNDKLSALTRFTLDKDLSLMLCQLLAFPVIPVLEYLQGAVPVSSCA